MHARPPGLQNIDVASLSPFQRALLTIDGTVTQFIEAYALEPVAIRVLDHIPDAAGDAADWLACNRDADVLRRRSALEGKTTGQLFAFADSVLLLDRLPAGMRSALEQETGGLGKILLRAAPESRREALWFGEASLRDLPAALGHGEAMQALSRTYRVIAAGLPMMLITENFPVESAARS